MQQGPTDSSFFSRLMHSLQNIFSFAVQSYLLKRGGGAGWFGVEPAVHRGCCPAEELKVWSRKQKYKLVITQVLLAL